MGLFTKSRPDTQRMLAKGKGSNKALVSQILQLRNSSSSSSSYDDGDDADIPPPLTHPESTAARTDQSESKKQKKKKKVWRVLQDNSMKQSNAYIPPGPAAPTPIDPFATEPTTLVSLSTNTLLYNQAAPPISAQTIITANHNFPTATKLFAKKKFQRLDSVDDGSLENVQQSAQQPLIQERSSKQSSKSAAIHGKTSSMKKNKNLLSKHIKPSSFSKMLNDDTPRSSSVGGDAIYYPPPTTIPIVPVTNVGTTKQDPTAATTTTDSISDQQHYPSKEFIMNVIRNSNSTGEEMFDIRSESTGSGNIQYNKMISIENGNQSLQRCRSIGSESDAYSQSVQNSIFCSDSGYPIATKTSNSFQQMIFDDKFQKLTAITKSETGSHTYSDLAKAATILTKVLSPEPNLPVVAPRAPPPPPPPPNSHMMEKSMCNINKASNENIDTMSCASTHSGKSRSDYRAAIRAKVQSPIKANKLHAPVMSNMGPTAGHTINTITTPISIANATFSNSVRVSDKRTDFSFEPRTNAKKSINTDPFMMARDFNVTEFTTNNETDNDDDPFQIGSDVIGSGSDDDAWNVHTSSFPYLGSASSSAGGSQHSKVDETRSINHHSFTDQVGKANSMDDALIESIRNASAVKSASKIGRNERGRDASPHEVRISHSEGDLDYAVAPFDAHNVSGVGRSGDYYYSGPNMQQLKKRNATKGVPANAIIGSMLFRQTQTCDEYCHEGELARNTKKNASHSMKKQQLKESPKSGGLNEVRDHQNYDEIDSHLSQHKVPRNVHTECSKSDVSSVTEEASSFYTKNLMQHKWQQPAQNILNHYNVQRGNKTTLQSRDMNAATR